MTARFELLSGCLDVPATVAPDSMRSPDRDGFAWWVLCALADDVDVRRHRGLYRHLQAARTPAQ